MLDAHLCIAPFAPLRFASGTPPLLGPLRFPPKGGSRAVRARYRSPMPAPKCLKSNQSGFKKPFRRYATSKSGEKQGKEGVGVWAQPIVARRSPRRAATRPEEARIGAEAVPGPWRPEKGLEALERGPGRPRYPPTPPPALLEPESRFPSC